MELTVLALVCVTSLFCGREVETLRVGPEIKAAWGDGLSVRQMSFGSRPSTQTNSKATCEAWVGNWDTVTSEGKAFTIRFSLQEDRIFGFIPNVARGSAGRFYGMPNSVCDEVTFTFTRPITGEVDRGKLRLTTKETFEGTFVKDTSPDTTLAWRGVRKQ